MFKRLFGNPSSSSASGRPSSSSSKGGGGSGSTTSGRAAFDAVDKLKDTLEMLDKREALLIKKISTELEKAREFNRSGNKRAALQCLKRKKLYESQCEVVANQQLKLQEQMIVLEGSKATAETFNALKSGAGAMKQLAKETDVDKVDKVMDEISDQTEKMRQVNEALGQQVGYAAELDEDELEAELAELDALDVEDALLQKAIEELEPGFTTSTGSKEEVVVMPDVPKMKAVRKMPANVKKIASTEEEELEALRAEMELFEFSAPKYYDFTSHRQRGEKRRKERETETAEMYFETSEKLNGLLSPRATNPTNLNPWELPPPLPWEKDARETEGPRSYTPPSSPPWSHVATSHDMELFEDGDEEESERNKQRRRQLAREKVEKKIVSKPAALRNKLVERVITGTQPVRRRSPRNLERKAYNFSRNAANSRPREVEVKETAASIREKRQMDSRMRIEAVAKNAELRAKRVNLMHRRATTTMVQEEEEEEEDMNDYGPSVTQVVGGFERKRRQVDETRWTLAENKKYITGTQPRKPSREYTEEKNRATATVKRNVKRVTSTRKYYGFGSTYTSPPKKATNQKRRREDDERFYEEEEEEEFQQHWPPRTTATISPHLQTASRAKGCAAMEAAKKEAAERRKMNDTMKIFNRPIAAVRKHQTFNTTTIAAVTDTTNDSSLEQADPNYDVFEFTPEPIEFGGQSNLMNKTAKTPKSNAQKLGASTQPEPFRLATEKRAIINRRQFLKDRQAELERETYAFSNKKRTATQSRVVAKTPTRTTSSPALMSHDSSDEFLVDVTGRACTTPKPFKLRGAAISERRKAVEKRESEQQHVMKTPKLQKSTGLNKKHVGARKGPVRGSRAEDRAVFAEINSENNNNMNSAAAATARTATKKESQNLLKRALKAPGTAGRKRQVTFNK
ncbi:unnamed protein product [Bathycoccus prasinos]